MSQKPMRKMEHKQFQDPQLSNRNMKNEVVRLVSCKINSGDCNCLDTWIFWKKKQAYIILEYNQTRLLSCLDLSGRPSTREIRCSPIFFYHHSNLLILRAKQCWLFLCILNIKWKWHLYINPNYYWIILKGRRILRHEGRNCLCRWALSLLHSEFRPPNPQCKIYACFWAVKK